MMFRVAKPYDFPRDIPPKGTLSEVNTGSAIFYDKHKMNGKDHAVFHFNLIDLLNRVFVDDGMRYLSIEQERFLSKFFKQADIVTKKLNANDSDPYKGLDDVYKQLDNFLGSYLGVNDGRFTR